MKIIYFAKIRELIGKTEEDIVLPSYVKTVNDLIVFLKEYNNVYKDILENNDFFHNYKGIPL